MLHFYFTTANSKHCPTQIGAPGLYNLPATYSQPLSRISSGHHTAGKHRLRLNRCLWRRLPWHRSLAGALLALQCTLRRHVARNAGLGCIYQGDRYKRYRRQGRSCRDAHVFGCK